MIIIEPACQQNSCITFIVFNNEVSTLTATVKSFACWIFFFYFIWLYWYSFNIRIGFNL